jgi:hypothetical protein
MPGWDSNSWGYHGDDGKKFHGLPYGTAYAATWGTGDTVECHFDQAARTISYIKNGIDLGVAFRDVSGRLYPVVGIVQL